MRISDWSSDVCSSDLTVVFGVSRDGMKSHENFKCKQAFPFELISDKDEAVCQLFDVIKLKTIGRASCRERVCQCVEISVVAVSLYAKVQVDSIRNVSVRQNGQCTTDVYDIDSQ